MGARGRSSPLNTRLASFCFPSVPHNLPEFSLLPLLVILPRPPAHGPHLAATLTLQYPRRAASGRALLKGLLDGCCIRGSQAANVAVSGGSDPLLRTSTIRNGKDAGFIFTGAGTKGRMEDCDVSANEAEVIIRRGADPLLSSCKCVRCSKLGDVGGRNRGGTHAFDSPEKERRGSSVAPDGS